ncbi:MAG: DNA polymerase [Acetobacterium sp.]
MEKMQRDGIMFDWARYEAGLLSQKKNEMKVIENRIKEILKIPEPFSLYNELISRQAIKKGTYIKSFSLEWLETKENEDALFTNIVAWKKHKLFFKSYGNDLRQLLDENNRLHPSWVWSGTVTNRIVAKDPCVQNFKKDVRAYFSAPQGSALIAADFSQIDLRVMAEISRDSRLIKIFCDGGDLYKTIAALIFNKAVNDISEAERQCSKAITLGMLFGITAHGIVKNLAKNGLIMTMQEANNLQQSFFQQFPGIVEFQRTLLTSDIIKTLGGFEFHNIKKPRSKLAMPIQGSSSEIFKEAIELLVDRLDPDVKIVCLLHDEIFVEAPEEKIRAVKKTLEKAMIEGAHKYLKSVPIIINFKESKRF